MATSSIRARSGDVQFDPATAHAALVLEQRAKDALRRRTKLLNLQPDEREVLQLADRVPFWTPLGAMDHSEFSRAVHAAKRLVRDRGVEQARAAMAFLACGVGLLVGVDRLAAVNARWDELAFIAIAQRDDPELVDIIASEVHAVGRLERDLYSLRRNVRSLLRCGAPDDDVHQLVEQVAELSGAVRGALLRRRLAIRGAEGGDR